MENIMKYSKILLSLFLLSIVPSYVYGDTELPELVREIIKKRIELYKQDQNKDHLITSLTPQEFGELYQPGRKIRSINVLTSLSPLAALIYTSDSNRDLIFELLQYNVHPDRDAILKAVRDQDVPTTLLFLHRRISQEDLNEALLNVALEYEVDESNDKIMKLLFSYGAQSNSRDRRLGQSILFNLVEKIIYFHIKIEIEISVKGYSYLESDDAQDKKHALSKLKATLEMLLRLGANPAIKDNAGDSIFGVIEKHKNYDKTSEQTKKELDELSALLKKSVNERIERMTDFLHTRALKDEAGLRQTPFKVKDIAQKIAEHVYKNDIHA
jgi:hypothetical protein